MGVVFLSWLGTLSGLALCFDSKDDGGNQDARSVSLAYTDISK